MARFMITTIDNPYNPFTEFSSWFTFDVTHQYNSCGYLARLTHVTDRLTEQEEDDEVERAIDEIIMHDPENIYKKVSASDFKNWKPAVI